MPAQTKQLLFLFGEVRFGDCGSSLLGDSACDVSA